MKTSEALAVVGDYTADQWGLITTAQATAAGIDSVTLYRLADAGHLEPVRRGVYAIASAPSSPHRDVQAAWLWLNPAVPAWKRPKLDPDGGVVSHRTAALVHDIGDMLIERIELSVPRRRSSRDPLVQLRQRELTESDVTLVDGLPVTTTVRTIEDLLADHVDASHGAAAIKDGVQSGTLNLDDLGDRIGPFARRYGVKTRDGDRLIDHFLDQIGTSRSELARVSRRSPETLPQLSLLSPEVREALTRLQSLNTKRLTQQLSSLAGTQAALDGHLLKSQQSAQAAMAAMAKQLHVPSESIAAAVLGSGQPRQADADFDEER